MKFIINLVLGYFVLLVFSACSKQAEEPYYDRAKEASKEAHDQLNRD